MVIIKYNTTWINRQLIVDILGITDLYERKIRSCYKQSVSPCHRNKEVLPDTGKAWRYCKIDGEFYYAYNNIPNSLPKQYRSMLPPVETLLAQNKASNDLETFFQPYLKEVYKDYLNQYGDCTPQQQTNLAKAAAIVEGCIEYIRIHNINIKKNDFFIEVANLARQQDWKYFPHNFRCIKRDRIMPVLEGGQPITSLVKLPRTGNENASQFSEEEVKSWILQLRAMGENYTNYFIIRKITAMCQLNEKPVPSERWIGTIMQSHNVKYLTATERWGENGRFANIYKGYVPMANALFAGDCWQVDSTRFNIIPHKSDDKKMRSINSICVRDVHSGDILGVEYDYSENRWAYTNALYAAVLEAKYLPYEIVFDRFPGHNSEEFKNLITDLENRGVKITISSKTTGKARLERHFSTLQTVFMQDSDKYYGEGIRSTHGFAHRSEKAIAAMMRRAKDEGFDLIAAKNEAAAIITKYRNTPLAEYSRKYNTITHSPKQLHEISEKPHTISVTESTIAYLFGLKKILQITHQGYIKTEINKVEFIYQTTDINIINRYRQVMVCYGLDDLSYCHLYEISNKPLKLYLGTAQEFSPVQGFGPDAQWNRLAKQKAVMATIELARNTELQLGKAVGDDITTLLTPGYAKKDSFQVAENNYVNALVATPMRPVNNDLDEGDIDIDVRDQY